MSVIGYDGSTIGVYIDRENSIREFKSEFRNYKGTYTKYNTVYKFPFWTRYYSPCIDFTEQPDDPFNPFGPIQ
jgi:hypothetical protein